MPTLTTPRKADNSGSFSARKMVNLVKSAFKSKKVLTTVKLKPSEIKFKSTAIKEVNESKK